ncbi:MAG: cytochrome D ubiquinol oxidase subunit I [Sterolibacterium sp.]|nr:cytochrome D ubiquinol oxidase subunit I [Sterolibacterium sp.]MBP9798890.1 cytochrome D ubiquinol oxidase subunit I [Sterolibacterium sp.]
MLDDILDYQQNIRSRPVWQPIPADERTHFQQTLPDHGSPLDSVHDEFMQHILPYVIGNAHPGFMGWVHGAGSPVGMLADMLAAGINANLGGREQIPVEVERQITRWMRELFQFPETASGLFVTGTSMANLVALLVARARALGVDVRRQGLHASNHQLVAYTSAGAHKCIYKAMDMAGIGSDFLRIIPTNARHEMEITALEQCIAADRTAGLQPFFIAATAGSVDVGAIDPLADLAHLAAREGLWFHIDGAFGALGILADDIAPLLAGIEQADSIAFDFHKWLQVPYDAGFVLVREGSQQIDTFAMPVAYLGRDSRGMAAGSPWPCDFGPDLSRSFKALKTWFTFKVYGRERLGQMISFTCQLARHLAEQITALSQLELMAPVTLNIVCFRYRCLATLNADRINAALVVALQESGIAAPSTTMIDGHLAIRCAIVNHRTRQADLDALLAATLRLGAQVLASGIGEAAGGFGLRQDAVE